MTGLTWQWDRQGPMTRSQALEYAKFLSLEDRENWRLPGARELETLLDRTHYRSVIREEEPFKDALSYWSSTTLGHQTKSARIVMFDGACVASCYKVMCLLRPRIVDRLGEANEEVYLDVL